MKQTKKIIKYCVIMAAMLLFAVNCSAKNAEVKRHIIFIVDFSGSVGENLENYWKIIELVTGCNRPQPDTKKPDTKEICPGIKGGDRITVLKITGQSRRKPEIMADKYFPEKGFFDSKLRHKKKLRCRKTAHSWFNLAGYFWNKDPSNAPFGGLLNVNGDSIQHYPCSLLWDEARVVENMPCQGLVHVLFGELES